MNRNPVGWFEIYVPDIDRSRKFYEAVLGIKLDKLDAPGMEMWAFPMEMDSPGAGGALGMHAGCSVGRQRYPSVRLDF